MVCAGATSRRVRFIIPQTTSQSPDIHLSHSGNRETVIRVLLQLNKPFPPSLLSQKCSVSLWILPSLSLFLKQIKKHSLLCTRRQVAVLVLLPDRSVHRVVSLASRLEVVPCSRERGGRVGMEGGLFPPVPPHSLIDEVSLVLQTRHLHPPCIHHVTGLAGLSCPDCITRGEQGNHHPMTRAGRVLAHNCQ